MQHISKYLLHLLPLFGKKKKNGSLEADCTILLHCACFKFLILWAVADIPIE